jgi:hypothetical protein
MKSKKLTLITTTIVFVAFAMPLQLTAQHTQYTVTDLGTLGGMRSFAGGLTTKAWWRVLRESLATQPCTRSSGVRD